ncbi:unnamed protein product [Fraxinus pennsylvanica]|uniref:Uncharacterized protein n=1 Tax=Fraxinus pennsylvanica TaxID=56036 RepID=A0AAD2ABH9_9LAMI|nr:unnamed protein product [Fraxinus pennsylvanica]
MSGRGKRTAESGDDEEQPPDKKRPALARYLLFLSKFNFKLSVLGSSGQNARACNIHTKLQDNAVSIAEQMLTIDSVSTATEMSNFSILRFLEKTITIDLVGGWEITLHWERIGDWICMFIFLHLMNPIWEGTCYTFILDDPHKTKQGAAALARLKVYEGIPPPYDKTKRMVIPDALKCFQ